MAFGKKRAENFVINVVGTPILRVRRYNADSKPVSP